MSNLPSLDELAAENDALKAEIKALKDANFQLDLTAKWAMGQIQTLKTLRENASKQMRDLIQSLAESGMPPQAFEKARRGERMWE